MYQNLGSYYSVINQKQFHSFVLSHTYLPSDITTATIVTWAELSKLRFYGLKGVYFILQSPTTLLSKHTNVYRYKSPFNPHIWVHTHLTGWTAMLSVCRPEFKPRSRNWETKADTSSPQHRQVTSIKIWIRTQFFNDL